MKSYSKIECTNGVYDLSYVTISTSPLLTDMMYENKPLKVNLTIQHLDAFDWGVNRHFPYMDPIKYSKAMRENDWDSLYDLWSLDNLITLIEACIKLRYDKIYTFWDSVVDTFFLKNGVSFKELSKYFKDQGYEYYNAKDTLAVLQMFTNPH